MQKDIKRIISKKLEILNKCYLEKSLENLDYIYDQFFCNDIQSLVIGTDNGEWFDTKASIKELFRTDWLYWGDLSIDTYDIKIAQNNCFYFIKAKGILDFKNDHVWDINLYLIFEENDNSLVCKLMQFIIPRNVIVPTVILNKSTEELEKYQSESKFISSFTKNNLSIFDVYKDQIQKILLNDLYVSRPYLGDIQIPIDQIIIGGNNTYFYFCCSGLATNKTNGDRLPFRFIGSGNTENKCVNITNKVWSLPFNCIYG